MPFHPFARLLAAATVASVAFFLLWPDLRSHHWGFLALPVAPLLLGVFTWWTVQSAPPFDDRAFHRTLPPSVGSVFRRVFAQPLAVATGIAIVAAIYAWRDGLGMKVAALSAGFLAVPSLAFCSACGVAFALGSAKDRWRSAGYIAVFGSPVFSAALLFSLRDDMNPAEPGVDAWLTGMRTMALAAAAIFPLIWWLVAARGRRHLGVVLAVWTSALLPWLYVHGDFLVGDDRVVEQHKDYEEWSRQVPPATFARLAGPNGAEMVEASTVLRVNGMEPSETTGMWGFEADQKRIPLGALRNGGFQQEPAVVGRAPDGSMVWGMRAWVQAMAETVRPGAQIAFLSEAEAPGNGVYLQECPSGAWKILGGDRTVWRKIATIPFGESARIHDPRLGLIRLVPVDNDTSAWDMRVEIPLPDFRSARVPLAEAAVWRQFFWPPPFALVEKGADQPLVVLNLTPSPASRPRQLLARVAVLSLDVGERTPWRAGAYERLKGGSVHLFWPEVRCPSPGWTELSPP